MKRRTILLILFLVAACSFIAGYWANRSNDAHRPAARKVLYYVDPMNPALKSDKPGIAPCGMALEPVYADQGNSAASSGLQGTLPAGTIRISPERQQLIGVKIAAVGKAPWSHSLRALGRVTPDETLVYRINAALSGWIQEVQPLTTGSLVKKNELLATFCSLQYRTTLATYVDLLRKAQSGVLGNKSGESTAFLSVAQLKKLRESGRDVAPGTATSQTSYYRKSLQDYGITDYQLEEMVRKGVYSEDIDIRAPIDGFILYRNVSPGLRFDRGLEFFRIADLSHVWILVDIFENEASYFKPGMRVKMELPYQKKTLYAQVSPVLPQFDPATRTLKVRLVAANPGFVLRPDMFVNVEFPIAGPPAIVVPVGAVLDSGLKKVVFVDRGNGFFEPRQVETGHSLGERVEIIQGLMPGEKIVVSGNFLIDSEARMQLASSPIAGKTMNDPVCHMNIDEDRSRAEGNLREYRGKTYYFCSPECRNEFIKEPERYLKSSLAAAPMPMADEHATHAKGAVSATAANKSRHDHGAVPGYPDSTSMPLTHDHGSMTMPDAQNGMKAKSPAMDAAAKPGAPGAASPPPMTQEHGSMTMPDAPAAPTSLQSRLPRRGGRPSREDVKALQSEFGAPGRDATSPDGSTRRIPGTYRPEPMETITGNMAMPRATMPQGSGPQNRPTISAPAVGSSAPSNPGPGGSIPVPGPNGPGLSGPGGAPGGPAPAPVSAR